MAYFVPLFVGIAVGIVASIYFTSKDAPWVTGDLMAAVLGSVVGALFFTPSFMHFESTFLNLATITIAALLLVVVFRILQVNFRRIGESRGT